MVLLSYAIVITIVVFLIRGLVSGSLKIFCDLAKDVGKTVLSSPRFFWALFVSYVLGTPFRPPVDQTGANKDLGDKFEREENSKSFVMSHQKSADELKSKRCPICKVYFRKTDIVIYLNCSDYHVYHTNCLDNYLNGDEKEKKCFYC